MQRRCFTRSLTLSSAVPLLFTPLNLFSLLSDQSDDVFSLLRCFFPLSTSTLAQSLEGERTKSRQASRKLPQPSIYFDISAARLTPDLSS